MKRTLLFFLIFLPMLASADAIEIDGIYYKLTEETKVAEVTRNPQQYKGDITIPESVEHEGTTYSVTKIGQRAFEDCSSLTSATISSSVTSIEAWAFYGCTSLASITIPNSVTSIGVRAFYNCTSLTSVTIPNSVTSIGTNAFEHCTSLTSVTLSNSLTSIGESTFQNCFSLASVTIPSSVTKIDGLAFRNCSNLASVTIPNSVTEICREAFCNCTSLASISIPNSVTTIERHAFAACDALTSVTIGNGVKIIEGHAFYGCDAVTSVHISDLESLCKISFGDSWSNPLYYAHHFILNGVEVKDLVIPNSVTSIGDYTFYRCSDLASITIPNSVTNIERYAFAYCSGVTSITIGSKVESIGSYAFNECQMLSNLYCYAENVPKTQSSAFRNINIGEVTLHVPAASISAYQAAGPWKNFKEIVALSAQNDQEEPDDYIPFVEIDKGWDVVISYDAPYYGGSISSFGMGEEVERDGKSYAHTKRYLLAECEVQEAGLFREENRRVYKYDEKTGKDIMMYDFSLKEGDTFTYEFGFDQPVNCKVLKQGWLTEGPKIATSCTLTPDDTLDIKYRWLHTWTIGRENGSGEYDEIATWVEGIGALENVFGLIDNGYMKLDYSLAYVVRKDKETGYDKNAYLPFSFCDKFMHGCNLPTGKENEMENDKHHKLTYELEGDRLHIYGEAFTQCGPYNYAFFYEKPTDDPLVHTIDFMPWGVWSVADSMALHATNFYVPGFDPNINYIVRDNQGEEHPVINKTSQMDYRPLVEEGKVWKVGTIPTALDSPVQVVDYYYFDGDTIIEGNTCKQMMRQRYVSPNYTGYDQSKEPSLRKVGAWYEENKKVYMYDEREQTMTLKYDFSLEANDTLHFLNEDGFPPFIIGPKQIGGLEGFKGVYREIMIGKDMHNTIWLEGVGVRDAPFRNAYDPRADLVPEFLISCTVGDEVIYLNDIYEDGATPESMGARKNRFDFTHTIKTKPKARKRSGEEESVYGEYNDKQLGINLNPLDDTYLVHITDETGKVVYEKSINAGNIVGLNVDISAYAKGRYTVTVENSDESFTGEFYAQTTGIEAIINNKVEIRPSIYNLQGQRLSSLQKGLNIVNGQKVFVK